MVSREDLALARARVVLADIAPEIPQTEIVADARLREDLELDLVSTWALATGLEKLAKVPIDDADICAATTLGDLLSHALTDVPADYTGQVGDLEREGEAAQPDAGCETGADDVVEPAQEDASGEDDAEDLAAAMEDLANLFK